VFNLWPAINTVVLAFTNAKPLGGGSFTGLANFERMLNDEQLVYALVNSIVYMLVCLPLLLFLPLLLAVLLEKKLPGITFFRTAFYTPVIASAVVVALIWTWLLEDRGLVNGLAQQLGFITEPLPFLSGRFPGGTLFFDAVSSLGMRISNRYVARSGNRYAPMTFCIDKVPALASLSPRFAAVSETPFFHGLPLSGLTLSTRVNIAIVQLFGMLKYVTIRFREFL